MKTPLLPFLITLGLHAVLDTCISLCSDSLIEHPTYVIVILAFTTLFDTGGNFCAGYDLAELSAMDAGAGTLDPSEMVGGRGPMVSYTH